MTSGCAWSTDAGTSSVTGPSNAASTALDFDEPLASSKIWRAATMSARPSVSPNSGVASSDPNALM